MEAPCEKLQASSSPTAARVTIVCRGETAEAAFRAAVNAYPMHHLVQTPPQKTKRPAIHIPILAAGPYQVALSLPGALLPVKGAHRCCSSSGSACCKAHTTHHTKRSSAAASCPQQESLNHPAPSSPKGQGLAHTPPRHSGTTTVCCQRCMAHSSSPSHPSYRGSSPGLHTSPPTSGRSG